MKPVGLANTRISAGYAQKSPRSLQDIVWSPASFAGYDWRSLGLLWTLEQQTVLSLHHLIHAGSTYLTHTC